MWRWIQAHGPEVHRRLHGAVKPKFSTWLMHETFVRIAGKWMYLFGTMDAHGQPVDFYLSESRDRHHTCRAERATGLAGAASQVEVI
jgi:transposase-like protein